MENNRLFELADELKALRDRKDALEAELKQVNMDIDNVDWHLSNLMGETETQNFTRAGTMFFLSTKTRASAKAGQKDELFGALRANGYGDLITETINANSLSSFVKEQIAENEDVLPGELPGETDAAKEFTGVILYHHPLFAYYRERFTGGNNAPDCGSYDGVTGVGNPGGVCAQCPLNQFGSGENGGKACKNKRRIFILREGELIPILLTLPTGSMKEFAVYVKRLLAKGKKSSSVVTRFSLQKVQNSGGIAYSQAKFAVDRVLTDEEQRYISAMAEQVKAFASRVAYDDAPGEVIDPETGEVMQPLN